MRTIRIIVADDHRVVRQLLVARLRREPDFDVVGEASTSAQMLSCVLTRHPDLLLVDPLMEDGLGMEMLRQVRQRAPRTHVIVLTTAPDTALQMELRRMGVEQVLTKDLNSAHLVEAIRRAARSSTRSPSPR